MRVQLLLAAVPGDQSPAVRGEMRVEDGDATGFTGWLELLRLLEDAIARQRTQQTLDRDWTGIGPS